MFNLCCNITIGKATFKFVNDVQIKKSIFSVSQTARIKLPLMGVVKDKGGNLKQVNISEQIAQGDKVTIDLGYNDTLRREFSGQVSRINYRSPLEVECEDVYALRNTSVKKSWKSASLKTLLGDIAGGLFTLSKDIPDITIQNFRTDNQSVLWVLEEIKSNYGLSIYFLPDGKLYAGLAYGYNAGKVKFDLRKNVVNPDDLKWSDAKDVKLKVNAICFTADGNKIEAEIGNKDGEIRTLYFYDVKDKEHLKKLAESEIQKYQFSGYRGQITAFLIPAADIGMTASVADSVYPVRGGDYYIESTEVTYNTSGGRRKVQLGIKLSA